MDPDKKTEDKAAAPATGESSQPAADATADKGSETVDATSPMSAAGSADSKKEEDKPAKQQNSLKQTLKKFRLYILVIALIAVVGIAYVMVNSLNGKKTPPASKYQNQTLTQSDLKQLTNSNESIGGSGETLNVAGNASLSGNVVVNGNLNVAGTIQTGSQFSLAQIKVSGTSTFASAQISSLQVAQPATFQGVATFAGGVNVAGGVAFTGTANFATLTDSDIVLTSNASIQGHVSFSPSANATPYRQISFGVLGNGGSASVFGSDTSGTVNINTGNNPVAGCFITVIFDLPFTNMPNILVSPVGYGAGASKYYVIPSKTSFKICTNNAAPPNQAFAFDYFIGATPN
jgi:cytoskeletal protein CcmA (bactofilin family)